MKRVFAIIPVFNRKEITLFCLRKLQEIVRADFTLDIVVIDDGSQDGTSDAIQTEYPEVHLLHGDGNLWWTGCINKGIRYARNRGCDYILTLNDDTTFDPDFLSVLLQVSQDHSNAVVGSLMVYQNETSTFYIAGAIRKGFRKTIHANYVGSDRLNLVDCVEADCLPGRSLLIPVAVIEKAGLFDEKRFPHGNADHEFTLRCKYRLGFSILVAVKSRVYTELNTRIINVFIVRSRKSEFIKSFINTRYGHNIRNVINTAFMHKNFSAGIFDLMVTIMGLIKIVLLKLLLPERYLKNIFATLNRESIFVQNS